MNAISEAFCIRPLRKLRVLANMIKFEHTIFALPFALASAVVAASGIPKWSILGWIILAMVGARTSAMAFNRIADLEYDRRNPRTSGRELPVGMASMVEAKALTLGGAAALVFAAYRLNPLAFALSPVALLIILAYSCTKRYTAWSHLFLGLSLGIAPVGAWIGVTGTFALPPLVLSAAVVLWTAGFDVIYSLEDVDFDRREGLFSIPARFGECAALWIARGLHAVAAVIFVAFGLIVGLGVLFYIGIVVVAAFLIREHTLVRPGNLSKLNEAFFVMNGYVSVGFLAFTVGSVVWGT